MCSSAVGYRSVLIVAVFLSAAACTRPSRIPAALTDDEFRNAMAAWSELAGEFVHAGNLVSNETHFPDMIRLLGTTGGVYIGVGPEQNFSYIAGLRPDIAFIVDIRRENRDLHLLYKALFEVSGDRAEFLARLFSRERPAGLGVSASVAELFTAISTADPSSARCEADVRVVAERLNAHRLALTAADHDSIAFLLRTFCSRGPAIRYESGELTGPSYGDLMGAVDLLRRPRSYLASEEAFAYVKDLHTRNLIVPLIGDFAGARALAAVGAFARRHDATVRVFYGSNVEVYLSREQTTRFCATLAVLPYDSESWFIGNKGMRTLQSKLDGCPR